MQSVGKGASFIYVETTISMVSGYVFWLVMSKITTTEIIGISSTLISLATIIVSIVSMGIPTGLQRFLGKSFSEKQLGSARIFIKASLLLVTIGTLASVVLIVVLRDWFRTTFGLDANLLGVMIILISSTTIATLLRSVIVASLRTKILMIVMSIASTSKIALAIVLLSLGTGALGLTLGFTINHVIASIALGLLITAILKSSRDLSKDKIQKASQNVMIASAAAWLPALIASIGIQLGTVVIYGSSGASQAGIYFIAFSIMTAISGLIYSLHSIAYPVLSGMTDGRKRFAWRVLKLSLIISLPLSSSFVVYAEDIMRLLGQQYVEGAQLLQILLLSMLPMAIVNAVTILAYAYGNYRHVLSIGLATNLPRVALYFFLVPIYGGQGAALSFSIGSIVGLIVTIFVARKIAIRLSWKDISVIFAVPMCLAFVQGYFNVNYGIGIFVTLLASYLLLMKFQVLTLQDAQDIAGVLPQQFSRPIVRALNIMNKKLNPS